MHAIALFAKPWWVNLLILVPIIPFLLLRGEKMRVDKEWLLEIAAFAIAFGFVEAAVVVYLRDATGLGPVPQTKAVTAFPERLLQMERFREAATMIMLAAVATLAGGERRVRVIAFLWAFALWDIFYYVWLRLAIGWPSSLTTPDVLFLIPEPWLAQVWFPIVISSLTVFGIWFRSTKRPFRYKAEFRR